MMFGLNYVLHKKVSVDNELSVTKISRNFWRVNESWKLSHYTVPTGFISNAASVYRWLWWLFTPAGELFEASIAHDYAYHSKVVSRELADIMFYKLMLLYGVPKWRAKLAYFGVRLGGKSRYGKRTYN